MKVRKTHHNSGFTLAEILVATAIFAVIMIAALMLYDRNQQVFKSSVEAADVQQNTRVAFDKMVSEVRMAGFDYDRDGVPTTGGSSEQPDEQIEYVNTRAITFRANLDYDMNVAGDGDHGRETALESTTFPVVTTGNDEIVTYALHSKTGTNSDTISFKVDVNSPRNGTESTITIDNVDLSGTKPPYELQRITIDPSDNTKLVRTTIADNIRDLKFRYFTDTAGTAANEITTMPLGTDGTNGVNRDTRATIRSVNVQLIGMNATQDISYVNPTETDTTVTAAKHYRTYKLESLLVPRNLGLKGMEEVEAQAPGAPTVTGLCVGACALTWVTWNSPAAGSAVSSYTVAWDTSATGSFAGLTPLGLTNAGWAGNAGLDPTKSYYFKVKSLNGYGSNTSAAFGPVFPINKTKSEPPGGTTGAGLSATGGGTAIADEIDVVWPNPRNNVSGAYGPYGGSTSCNSAPSAAQMPSYDEVSTYKVYRSKTSPVDTSAAATPVWTGGLNSPGGTLTRDASNNITFRDITPVTPATGATPPTPKENCTSYFYKIVAVEAACAAAGTANDNDPAASVSNPSLEISGASSLPNTVPATPGGFGTTAASNCSAGICNVYLQWNAVTQDTGTNPSRIVIPQYSIHIDQYRLSLLGSPTLVSSSDVTSTTNTYSDLNEPQVDASGNFYQYRYKVKAQQSTCATVSESAYSNTVIFPCASFVVNPPASGVISGSGAQGDPYLITSPSSQFTVQGSGPLSTVTVTYTNGTATTTMTATPSGTPPTATWTFNLPLTANDGTTWRADVTVTDAANGCSSTTSVYVEDAPSSCCLEPYKLVTSTGGVGATFNANVMTLDSTNNTVVLQLLNDCDQDLTITSIAVDFTQDSGNPSSRLKLRKVELVSPVGTGNQDFGGTAQQPPVTLNNTTAPIVPNFPAGVRIIRAATANKTYTMNLIFQNRAVTLADILEICITYTDSSGTPNACRIAPQASRTVNSCTP